MDQTRLRFWGVRGSIACAGKDYERYGGNTPCVEATVGGRTLIFDAGTGIRPLGDKLAAAGLRDVDLFLSHTHLDHIVGLPFFSLFFDPQNTIRLWAGHLFETGGIEGVLHTMMADPLFPVDPKIFAARVEHHDFKAGAVLHPFEDVRVETQPLNHPSGATGYRVCCGASSFAYVTDHEPRDAHPDPAIVALSKEADYLITDTSYTDEEYEARRGWGHASWRQGLAIAREAGTKTLVLFHHDPSHPDDVMARIEEEAVAEGKKWGIAVFAAREGMELTL